MSSSPSATTAYPTAPGRGRWLAAALLVGMGVVLAPQAMTTALLGPDRAPPEGLIAGLWLFKGLLVFHGIVAAALPAWLTQRAATRTDAATPWWAITVLLVAAVALRLPGLGDGLWFDEIQTLVDYVSQPWGVLLTTFDSTNQHLLYSISARAASAVIADPAVALRLPAVLFGALSLWAALVHGRRWLPATQAWWAVAVLLVSYHHIWFSQNARGYTGLLLGTLVATTLFLDLLRGRTDTPSGIWKYAVVMALTVMTHVTALVVVAGHGLVWLWQARRLGGGAARWAPFAALALAGTVSAMVYAPLLPQVLTAVGESGTSAPSVEWKRPGWFAVEALLGLIRGVPAGAVVVPIALAVVLVGFLGAWRRDRVATALATLPMALLGAALLASGHNLWPRFFFFGAAFVVQWAVHGGFLVLERLMPAHASRVGQGGLAVITAASLVLLPRAWSPKQDYPAAVAWLAEHRGPNDLVAGSAMMQLPINAWLGADWPIVSDSTPLAELERGRSGAWVAYTFPIRVEVAEPELWRALQERYQVATVIPATIGGGEIVIARRRAPGAQDEGQRTRDSAVPAPNQ